MNKSIKQPVVLTVAGFDPSGGAGILADVKTMSAFGCFGVAAITSITFQNTQRVFGKVDLDIESLRRQLMPLFDDFEIAAIKTGMLPTAQVNREIAAMIRARSIPVVVIDPVLTSTVGDDLVDDDAANAIMEDLVPLASVVTPNIAEAGRLARLDIGSTNDVRRAAEAFLRRGAGAVLITGGDVDDDELSTDLLLDASGSTVYSTERVKSTNTHGTGCTLASALACLLARGLSLRVAIPIAKQYIAAAIHQAPGLGTGNGPLKHFLFGFDGEKPDSPD